MDNHISMLIALYLIIVGFVLPYMGRERIFSIFADVNSMENDWIEETKFLHRQQSSIAYLRSLEPLQTLSFHKERLQSENLNHLIIALVPDTNSEHRHGSQYLIQLAVHLHRVAVENKETGVFFCNSSGEFNQFLSKIEHHFPVYSLPYDNSEDKLPLSAKRENLLKNSFVSCIRMGLNLTHSVPKLVTIFNKNVLPLPHFSRDLDKIVNYKFLHRMSSGDWVPNSNQWLFLHLQEPAKLRAYQYDSTSFRELLIISLVGATLFHVTFKFLDPHLSSRSVMFTIVYGGSFFLTFALCLGRPYTTELRRIIPALYRTYDPPEALHFSALTLPSSSFGMIEPLLQSIKCSQYVGFHRVLDSLINSLEIPGYVISPSLVRYV